MKRILSLVGILVSSFASDAVVIRHDVPDSAYQVNGADYPNLAYLPGEGHGVLISKQWVVTAAHAVLWRPVHDITLNGASRPVEKAVVHPGYKAAPNQLKSRDAAPLMEFMASSDDIALIKLKNPVYDITPAKIYRGADEEGQIVKIIGRGASGNGLVGQYPHSPHRGVLRLAYSRVISTDARWLGLRFGAPPNALPLEGMPAGGDSGAPIFIETNCCWELAGLVSRKLAHGDLSKFPCCLYGQVTYHVCVSRYAT